MDMVVGMHSILRAGVSKSGGSEMRCYDCDRELPEADGEGLRHTCECGRLYVSYCKDFSSSWPRYTWNLMPKGGKYREHPWLPGIPIAED